MVFSATLKSTRKPRRLETHLGARVQSDGTIFPGVRDHESLPGSTGVILAASHQLVQSNAHDLVGYVAKALMQDLTVHKNFL